MKRNTMQRSRTTRNSTGQIETAQQITALRLRVLQAKAGFLALGTESYIPFIETQAVREGNVIDRAEKLHLRQIINGRVTLNDVARVELIERALNQLQAA